MCRPSGIVCTCSLCKRENSTTVCVFEEAITSDPQQYGLCVDCVLLIDEPLGTFFEIHPITHYILDTVFKPNNDVRGRCELESRWSPRPCQVLVFDPSYKEPKSVCLRCLRSKRGAKLDMLNKQLYELRTSTKARILRVFGGLATGSQEGLCHMFYSTLKASIEPASHWLAIKKKAIRRGPLDLRGDDDAVADDPMYFTNGKYVSRDIINRLHVGSFCYVLPETPPEFSTVKGSWEVEIKWVGEDSRGRLYRGVIDPGYLQYTNPRSRHWNGPFKCGDRIEFRARHIDRVPGWDGANDDLIPHFEFVKEPKPIAF